MQRMRTCVRYLCLAVFVAAPCLYVTGCNEQRAEADQHAEVFRFVDHTGRTIRLDKPPVRIATTSSFVVEILEELDHPPILRPDLPDAELSAAACAIPTWAVDHAVGPNLEQLVAADPDLVLTTPMFAGFVSTIEERLGVPVALVAIRTIEDLTPTVKLLGKIADAHDKGNALAGNFDARIQAIQPPEAAKPPHVYAIFGTPDASFAFLPNSYLGSMIEHLGGKLITEGAPPATRSRSQQFTSLSLEFLVECDPDVIFVVSHGPDRRLEKMTAHRAWAQLAAVRGERVHALSHRRYLTNPGLSAVEALEELRSFLYTPDEDKGR